VRWIVGSPGLAYASVFGLEALIFVAAAGLAMRIAHVPTAPAPTRLNPATPPGTVELGTISLGGTR